MGALAGCLRASARRFWPFFAWLAAFYVVWALIAVLTVLSQLCGAFLWLFRLGEGNGKPRP